MVGLLSKQVHFNIQNNRGFSELIRCEKTVN